MICPCADVSWDAVEVRSARTGRTEMDVLCWNSEGKSLVLVYGVFITNIDKIT